MVCRDLGIDDRSAKRIDMWPMRGRFNPNNRQRNTLANLWRRQTTPSSLLRNVWRILAISRLIGSDVISVRKNLSGLAQHRITKLSPLKYTHSYDEGLACLGLLADFGLR